MGRTKKRYRPMVVDIFSRLYQIGLGVLVPIPVDNALAKLYVFLDLLAKIFLLGNLPEGGLLEILPF